MRVLLPTLKSLPVECGCAFSLVADPDGPVEAKAGVLEGTLFMDFVSRTVLCVCLAYVQVQIAGWSG